MLFFGGAIDAAYFVAEWLALCKLNGLATVNMGLFRELARSNCAVCDCEVDAQPRVCCFVWVKVEGV